MRAQARFWMAITALASATPCIAAPAPHLAETSFAALPQPLALPYNEAANAHREIAAARASARAHHKLLLVDFGGNWCPDCRILAATMALPDLAPFVRAHYEVVLVDVGRYTKNLDIAVGYGLGERPRGVPAVVIIDPRTNRPINAGHETALADARSMNPQALADWLASWTK